MAGGETPDPASAFRRVLPWRVFDLQSDPQRSHRTRSLAGETISVTSTLAALIWVVVYLSGAMTKEAVGCTARLMPENTVTLGGESALIDKLCVTAVNGIVEGAERRPHRRVHSVTPESPKPRFTKEAEIPKGGDLDGHEVGRDPIAESPGRGLRARQSTVPRNKKLPIDGLVPWLVQRIGRYKNGVNAPLHGRMMMDEVEVGGGQLRRRQWYR
ncbi:hypothetical protein HO133_009941 [Letharia lupina]|uniref:Uncharacterized protein n=1 Tax=Letharia lupina TaxID=560253 RepID=A0A8H6CJM5_9LECA|nr:uncharacterized protein HO133_009941 [Letharia lupina]KAF6224747.1 hypothetical protein HO133_009941 [Letharia lupina]